MNNARVPIVGFAAYSGTGKTTLLRCLIPLLKARGLRVGLIKHSHHSFEIDHPGKDSYALRQAGASPVMLCSALRRAMVTELAIPKDPLLNEELAYFDQNAVDLILVEGFKRERFPKIELCRPALGKPLLYPNDDAVVAVAADGPLPVAPSVPLLDLNRPDAIADFIVARFFKPVDTCMAAGSSLLSLDEALRCILADIAPLSRWERLPLKAALGRVLFQDVPAVMDLPPFANSAMDGYALRAADVADDVARLTVIGTSWAGQPYDSSVAAGQCVRIFTGAMLPEGADAVVMQEDVAVDGASIRIPGPLKSGQHVRRVGEELRVGATALAAGKRLGPADVALLASLGQCDVMVQVKPRVAFFSTGDELRGIGSRLASGQIYDSNRYALDGLLRDAGAEVLDLGVVVDDPVALKTALVQAAAMADVVLTTGGVSVGKADFITGVLAEIGQIRLWKMAIKPGKPMAFGRIGQAWFFGLPGNPVSVQVGFRLAVRPALTKLEGATPKPPLRYAARSRQPLKKTAGRVEFQRGLLERDNDGQWWVSAFAAQGSHLLTGMSRADCLIVLPVDCQGVAEGDAVEVEPLAGV